MTNFIPRFIVYKSDGATTQYTFEYVTETNWPREGDQKFIEHTNLRSNGSIIIPGGQSSWDLEITGCLLGTDYSNLISKKFSIQSDIVTQTKYVLKIDKTSTTVDTLKVMRLSDIKWGKTNHRTYQFYTVIFKVGCWS